MGESHGAITDPFSYKADANGTMAVRAAFQDTRAVLMIPKSYTMRTKSRAQKHKKSSAAIIQLLSQPASAATTAYLQNLDISVLCTACRVGGWTLGAWRLMGAEKQDDHQSSKPCYPVGKIYDHQ
jgi:hypothetical protein